MKKFGVTIPLTGYVYVELEAESEEEAVAKGMAEDFSVVDIEDWETVEQVCQGNICYAMENKAYAEELA